MPHAPRSHGATIVFDLDGTLVHTAPDLAAAANHALGLVGLAPVAVDELQPFIGHGSRAMIEDGSAPARQGQVRGRR